MNMLKEWIFTNDHKRIGILYLIGCIAGFGLAGFAAMLIRLQQYAPGQQVMVGGDYNHALYFHAGAMLLAFIIPILLGFFGNYFIPLMIGASQTAFPRLSAMSLWFFWGGIILALVSMALPDGPDVMWTGTPPYSEKTTGNTLFYTMTVLFFGLSSMLTAINLLSTVFWLRAPGIKLLQLNMFTWTCIGALTMQVVFLPVLASAVTMLSLDKYFGFHFFDPAGGGDPGLYQNLFWFYSHPVVYVIFLPAVGILFDVVATMAKNPVFNYKAAVFGGVCAMVVMSSDVWVHHIFTAGFPDWIRVFMMITTLMISVPVGVMMLSLWGTLYKGSITYNIAMYYASACFFLVLVGGLTGIPNAMVSTDVHLHSTSWVHAHFHFVMALFATFAVFAGLYYWFPKMTGRLAETKIGVAGFWLSFIGANVTFWPLLIIGAAGMPRRYWDYDQFPTWFTDYHHVATYGAFITALGMVLALGNLAYCAFAGVKSEANPWRSKSLEWTHTANPPIPDNFTVQPELAPDWTPYNYVRR